MVLSVVVICGIELCRPIQWSVARGRAARGGPNIRLKTSKWRISAQLLGRQCGSAGGIRTSKCQRWRIPNL